MARKPYVARQSALWWLRNPAYRRYMIREATSVPLFAFCILLIYGVYSLSQGETAFSHWLQLLRSPPMLLLQFVAFAAVLFHAWTWIELVPKILVLDKPPLVISGSRVKRAHQLLAVAVFVAVIGLLYLTLGAARDEAPPDAADTAVTGSAVATQAARASLGGAN